MSRLDIPVNDDTEPHILALEPNEALMNEISMFDNIGKRAELYRVTRDFTSRMSLRVFHLLYKSRELRDDTNKVTSYPFETLREAIEIVRDENALG